MSSFIILHAMQPLNWREKFVGILSLLVGIIFLALLVLDFISARSSTITSTEGNFVISRTSLFLYIRVGAAILISVIGAIALFKQSRTGWIMVFSIHAISLLLMAYLTVFVSMLGMFAWAAFTGIAVLFALLCIIFLLLPSTRIKFRVSSKTILPTLVFLLAIGALFFFLQ